MVQQLITPWQALDDRSTIHYTYTNNHSNELGRNYIALKCIVKYIILIKKINMHTLLTF